MDIDVFDNLFQKYRFSCERFKLKYKCIPFIRGTTDRTLFIDSVGNLDVGEDSMVGSKLCDIIFV